MANWFYVDGSGHRQGPVSDKQLKELAESGVITPSTMVENENGQSVSARKVTGLRFLELSRAVFIFLAVFVGIFGVHDFYAKHARRGWIHLALLFPWILAFIVSVLGVFGYTLYALSYSPFRKEIRELKQAVIAVEKEIKKCEKTIEETGRQLAEAKAGRLREPEVVRPKPDERTSVKPKPGGPEPVPPKEGGPKPVPPREPRERRPPLPDPVEMPPEPKVIVPEQTVKVDEKLVEKLENALQELHGTLMALTQQKTGLLDKLEELQTVQGAQQVAMWLGPAPLWLYFFFAVLPFVSWVMAMLEIIYVTKDGTGTPLGF